MSNRVSGYLLVNREIPVCLNGRVMMNDDDDDAHNNGKPYWYINIMRIY